MINQKVYNLPESISLTPQILTKYVQLFWDEVFFPLHLVKNDMHLLLLCKVSFVDTELGYKTLADMRKVNYEDCNLFAEYLGERLGILSDSYTVDPIHKIIFSYVDKKGSASESRTLLQPHIYNITTHRFNNIQLPLSMEPADYGTIIGKDIQTENVTKYFVSNGKHVFVIETSLDNKVNKVRIEGAIDLQCVDTKISEDLFRREIGKNVLYIKNNEIVVKSKQLNAKPFRKLQPVKNLNNSNFLTIDIETINIDGKQIPYLICGFDGKDYFHSYAADLSDESIDKLFADFIKQIVKNKNVKYIYAHNLSGFDGIFLLRHLLEYSTQDVSKYGSQDVSPIIFNGKLMGIKVKLEGRTIIFKDSYLLLPLALRKLCVSFRVATQKTNFPFLLTDINYVGEFPEYGFWSKMELSKYENLKREFNKTGVEWSFRDEAIKYCYMDCACLYEVLIKFNELIFKEFSVNIHGSLTLPSLSMKIFKIHYMPKDTIYQLLGDVEKDIRESYTGGAVDVYLHHNVIHNDFSANERTQLYYYDVNSLYPTVMSKVKLPVGKPIAFEGDIRAVDPKAFGFFYCHIYCPEYIQHPILQRRIKTANGLRTVAGTGEWTGWVCSYELDAVLHLGYQFKILQGYKFETAIIFDKFVDKMAAIRQSYPKSDPMNLIAKLLMNSLYGKFGQRSVNTVIEIFDSNNPEQALQLQNNLDLYGDCIKDHVQIDQFNILVRPTIIKYVKEGDDDLYHGLDVNIAIASGITSGGRAYMSQLKNNPEFNLYYSDTDSVVINKELSANFVGNKVGQFKLEHVIKEAVFLAPKVYGFITTKGLEFIKTKGLRSEAVKDFNLSNLENLLKPNSSFEFTQEKWFKNMYTSEITVVNMAYILRATTNKRQSLFQTCLNRDDTLGTCLYKTFPFKYSDIIVDKITK